MISRNGRTLRRIRGVFEQLDLRWYLFGAQATFAYGVVRTTEDIDVTVLPGERSTPAIATALEAGGFSLRFSDAKFVEQTRVLPVRDRRNGVEVDVVLGGAGLDALIISRVRKRKLGGVIVPVAAVEDLVALKVLAGREKDRTDVLDMLRIEQNLNVSVVRATLTELEEALDQSDLVPTFEGLLKRARTPR